jgi:hypothetical protein
VGMFLIMSLDKICLHRYLHQVLYQMSHEAFKTACNAL